MKRNDLALLLAPDLRAVLADIKTALDELDARGYTPDDVGDPLRRAYRALAGRDYTPPGG